MKIWWNNYLNVRLEIIFTPKGKSTNNAFRNLTSNKKRRPKKEQNLLQKILDSTKYFETWEKSTFLSMDKSKLDMTTTALQDFDPKEWNIFIKLPDYNAIPRLNNLLTSPKTKGMGALQSPKSISTCFSTACFNQGVTKQRLNKIMYRKRGINNIL